MSENLSKPARHRSTGVAIASVVLAATMAGCGTSGDGVTEPGSTRSAAASQSAQPSVAAYSLTIQEISPIEIALTLPDGWSRLGWVVIKNAAHLGLFPVANVYSDPCHWAGALPDPPVGPSVDDLATALVNQPTRHARVSDITLDGFTGKLVKMKVPSDISFSDCDKGLFGSWSEAGSNDPSRYHHGPGEIDDVYIINVEGTRVVIDAAHMPSTAAEELAELEGMVASIDIQP